ncbi:hypothetical protein BC629DRAFT_1184246 [Irpex lacteus]|nr:hypothetical protein BC629DRAFT_1184246 [Irpex lacteus]
MLHAARTEIAVYQASSSREPRAQRSSGSNSRHTTASKGGGISEKTIHFRTKPCTFFFTARGCVKGTKCNFRHDKLEVEPVQTSSAYSGSDCEPAPREQRRRRPAQNVAVGPRLIAESVSRLPEAGSTNKTHPIRYCTIGGGVMIGRASTGSSPPSPATPLDPQSTLSDSDNNSQLPPDYEEFSDSTTVYENQGNIVPLPAYIPLYIPHPTALGGVHSTPPSFVGAQFYYHYNPYLPTSPVQPHAMLAPPPMLPLPYPHPPLPGTLWVSETPPEKPMLGSSPVFINGRAELPDVVCGLYADPGGLVIPLRSPVALPMYPGIGVPVPRPSSAPPPSDCFAHSTWLGDEHSRRVSYVCHLCGCCEYLD